MAGRHKWAAFGLAVLAGLALVPTQSWPADAARRVTDIVQPGLPSVVVKGRTVTVSTWVEGPKRRKVHLQHRRLGGPWRTVATRRTSSERVATWRLRVRRVDDRWVWKTKVGSRWRVAARTVGPRREWRVVAPRTPSWTRATSHPELVRVIHDRAGGFPLGWSAPTEVSQQVLAPGVSLTRYDRGRATDGLTLSLRIKGRESGTRADALSVAARARRAGWSPRIERVVVWAVADHPRVTSYMVRVGRWTTDQQRRAEAAAARLTRDGLRPWVDRIGEDGLRTSGPFSVQVLTVDAGAFSGSCVVSTGESSARREKTSAMADELGAIAAVNGGFFDIGDTAGFAGDPLGVSVQSGALVSEAVAGRTAVVLKDCHARITELDTRVRVVTASGSRRVAGVNRSAAADEIVLFTPHLGRSVPDDGGVDVHLDADGRVTQVGTGGAEVPDEGAVLHGRGAGARWLTAHVRVDQSVSVPVEVVDQASGRLIGLHDDVFAVGGAIGLVRDGQTRINAAVNGHFSLGMVRRRHPRTLLGSTADGRLLLVTVDGRRPEHSVGASLYESARLMSWLGATDALSLDGGGSTTMVVGGDVVNEPRGSAERAVGDAILILGAAVAQ